MSTRERSAPRPAPAALAARASAPRVRIEAAGPAVDCGRYPVKRTPREEVRAWADVVADGPDVLRVTLRVRDPGGQWTELPMSPIGPDRFGAVFAPPELGRHAFTVVAWIDAIATWQQEVRRKRCAGETQLTGELAEGEALLRSALPAVSDAQDRRAIERALDGRHRDGAGGDPVAGLLDPVLADIVARHHPRADAASLEPPLEVEVDAELARVGAWYELFPRSFGGLEGVERELPRLAELGFDVVYLTPIHPIGRTGRKGRNNALVAAPDDPGSPWAIGAEEGGHEAVDPELGTVEDIERLAARARELGLEIALDLALQCSPDHPWLREHPEWFRRRPDGTIKYAENPPKRYQDIVSLDFDSPARDELWQAVLDLVLLWVERGIRIFRVDNPHTKPFAFWEWLIAEVRRPHPDVVFLAEAFTRPLPMQTLAKLGFDQSYTYFTWRTTRAELEEYVAELAGQTDFFRPNFFANTPDILHEYLQDGGRPAFEARLVLAATLSPSYGIYSGFERCENVPVRAGSEEYLDSEKYERKQRTLDGPLLPLVGRLNEIRRENAALRRLDNVVFLDAANDALLAYAKVEGASRMLVVVNLDPHEASEGAVLVPPGGPLPDAFTAHDLLTGARYAWHAGRNFVRLEPGVAQAHVLRVEP